MGITPIADLSDLKKAYKKLSSKYHPDKSSHPKAKEIFCSINESYNILMHHMENKKTTLDILLTLEEVYHGKKIKVGNDFFVIPKGNPLSTYTVKRGDKSFTINTSVKKHKVFKLINGNLHINVNICALKAITGTSFEIKHISGDTITVDVPKAIQNGYTQTINGMGIPKKDDQYTDLKINYKVIVPKLSDSKIKKLKELLLT